MANISERKSAILAKVAKLKKSVNEADSLVEELNKEKDKLPSSVKSALTAYKEKKKS